MLLNMGAVACLLRAYEHLGFGVAYPVTGPRRCLLVLPLAAAVAGEWPRTLGIAGVGLVSAAVMLLALRSGRGHAMTREGLAWTLVGSAFTAGYAVCDAQGVRQAGSPLAYGCALTIANAIAWGWLQRRAGSPLAALASQKRARQFFGTFELNRLAAFAAALMQHGLRLGLRGQPHLGHPRDQDRGVGLPPGLLRQRVVGARSCTR